jgi:hypothetical protein
LAVLGALNPTAQGSEGTLLLPLTGFLNPGKTASLIALPHAQSDLSAPCPDSIVGFLADADGATVNVVLRDATGSIIASADAALTLEPNASRSAGGAGLG